MKKNPSKEFINKICSLYGDVYDDREEDSRPGGEDWARTLGPNLGAADGYGNVTKILQEIIAPVDGVVFLW